MGVYKLNMKAKETVHIIPVGHTKETLVESTRQHKVTKVILLTDSEQKTSEQKKARKTAQKIAEEFGTTPTEKIRLDLTNILDAAQKIAETINTEKKQEHNVKINLSGSLRTANIAGYIAAQITQTPAYIGTPKYEDETVIGIKEIINLPLIPIKEYRKDKKKILKQLKNKKETPLEELIKTKQQDKERSRLNYHLKQLTQDNLITTEKDGRKTKIKLTPLGKIYAETL